MLGVIPLNILNTCKLSVFHRQTVVENESISVICHLPLFLS